MSFYAPLNGDLVVGYYDGATRASFQAPTDPGLNFDGNGRGDNMLTGFFQILEASYAPNGDVLSFAADFTQFDEGVAADYVTGGIRFNSTFAIPAIPEPETYAMVLAGLGLLGFAAYNRRKVLC